MMKQRRLHMIAVLVLVLCNIVPMAVQAQRVSEEQALQKAEQFFGKANQAQTGRKKAPRKSPKLALASNRDEFYVYNDQANGGYVIISGDERMPDVLGYSYNGNYDADNLPCNMQAWMEEYAAQVTYLREHPTAKLSKRNSPKRQSIEPMLTCWFNQGAPYNNKCPVVNGDRCGTGCVATAMAQIMFYHQWPKQTTTVIPGYTTGKMGINMPAIPITTIDWDNILEDYYWWEVNYNEEQADAISTLMLLCGMSVQMDYEPTGSGAATYSWAFRNYFGYDDIMEEVFRVHFKSEIWEQIMYEEMISGRPVLYSGFPPSEGESGHAFVMDGYDNGYFHVNWGWGGSESWVLMTDDEGWEGFTHYHSAIIGIQPAYPDSPSRYAVLEDGKMTLYYDNQKANRSGTVIPHKDDWANYKEEVTKCVIDPSFANIHLKNLNSFFSNLNKIESIEGIENLNTSMAGDMRSMFSGCSSLTSLDVSGFKTDNVTTMEGLFFGCSGLKDLDVSGFKTENVTSMSGMFYGCSSLTNLDVSGFKTDNVTNMRWTFGYCHNLTSLDVSRFKTDEVTDMDYMFYGCSSLTSLDVSRFKTDNVKEMVGMFRSCSSLKNLDVSGFKTDEVTDMGYMFYGCSSLTSLDVSRFKTDKVTDMRSMFSGCSSLTSLDVSRFKTDKVTDISSMFVGCSSLTSLDVSGFKTDKVTDMSSMFEGCSGLTSLDVSGFKTDKVTDMSCMFSRCSGLISLDVSGFKTDNVTDMRWTFSFNQKLRTIFASEKWSMSNVETTDYMFTGCTNLTGGAGTTYDKNHVDGEYARIDGGSDNPGYFTYKIPKYYITYMVDGKEYKTYDIEPGATIMPEAKPEKEGYTFSGWSEIPETMPAHDVTVTGTFSVNTYKLKYIVDGEEYKTYEVEYGDTITPEAVPEKEGYTFSGWSGIPETMPAHDVTVTGTFSISTSLKEVPFGLWNGWGADAYMIEAADCLWLVGESASTAYGDVSVIPYADLSGYSKLIVKVSNGMPRMLFNRDEDEGQWNEDETQSHLIDNTKGGWSERYFSQDGDTYIADLSLMVKEKGYAHLHAIKSQSFNESVTIERMELVGTGIVDTNSYKLIYMIDNEIYKTVSYHYGDAITPEPNPEREGYTFNGWSGVPIIMPTHDVTVTGTFTVNTYKLTYIVDGEEYKTYEVEYGATITPEPAPEKEGYTFSGWSEIPETMPAHDVTVTGTFEQKFNVGDVVKVLNFIMGEQATDADMELYDINGDGELNIGDVTLIVKFILDNGGTLNYGARRYEGMTNDLSRYTAVQFELKTGKATVKNIHLVENLARSHQLMYQQVDAETYAVVVYSPTNELLRPDNNHIIAVETDGYAARAMTIRNITAASPAGETANYHGLPEATGIQLMESNNSPAKVYDLNGRRQNGSKGQRNVIYIINGKKAIIK